MRKSDLIAKLQKEVDALGDGYLLSYKIEDAGGGNSWWRYSPTRVNQRGQKMKMSPKEFRDFVLDERFKQDDIKEHFNDVANGRD